MSNYPFTIIYSCSENVSNADYVDITFDLKDYKNIISVVGTTGTNVNVHATSIAAGSARLNFSAKFTGTVKYTVIGKK